MRKKRYWCNQFENNGITVEETGRLMYEIRWSTGLPWRRIAEDSGVTENVACQYARRYALRFGEAWPIQKQVKAVQTQVKGQKIYDAACLLAFSKPGVSPFSSLSSMIGVSVGTIRNRARLYAQMYDKQWPIPVPYVPSWGEISYELRDGSNCSWTWVSIQEEVGFKHTTHCVAAARTWAQKNGLPWPIRRKEK